MANHPPNHERPQDFEQGPRVLPQDVQNAPWYWVYIAGDPDQTQNRVGYLAHSIDRGAGGTFSVYCVRGLMVWHLMMLFGEQLLEIYHSRSSFDSAARPN
jgi:hypothetical protein